MELLKNILVIIIVCFNLTYSAKICALKKYGFDCKGLEEYHRITCEYVNNEMDCLTKIDSGEIDFGLINAETFFLGSCLTSNVIAIAQTKPETNAHWYQYETVIVSKEKIESLRGMSYCHPGFAFSNISNIPPLILKEFEQYAIKNYRNNCDPKFETSIECEIFNLNEIFGPSCRPGEWSLDKNLDEFLHNNYPKLIKLCQELDKSPFAKSLDCMLKNNNSIALSSLNTVNNIGNKINASFWYYCKDGTISKQPCIWSKQPYQLLIINKKNNSLKNSLKKWLTEDFVTDLTERELEYLKKILENNEDSNVQLKYTFNTEDSLQSFRNISSSKNLIVSSSKMKWCTTSDKEQIKCEWLSQAGVNYGIHPVIECIKKSSDFECLKAINYVSKSADLMVISTELGYFAKKNGLSAIAFPKTSDNPEINTLLLIKDDKNIDRLENLKGKKGCFPLYGGIAWLSFAKAIEGIGFESHHGEYGKLLSDFLGDSCMPGAMDTNRNVYDTINSTKMCELCKKTGNTCDASESKTLYFDTSRALKCLDEAGDFAVIVKNSSINFPTNVKIMCKNGTFSMMDTFDVDEECYLSVVASSGIMTSNNDSLNKDIQLALLQYELWFSKYNHTPFRLFDSFNSAKDLLFKDTTIGLELPSSERNSIKNYAKLFDQISYCETCYNTGVSIGNVSIVVIRIFVIYATFLNYF